MQNNKSEKLITIDGPAASGKSSLSRELAKKLGWKWLSTGVFYRGLAWMALQEKQHSSMELSEERMIQLASDSQWLIQLAPDQTIFCYEEQNKTSDIYTEEVDIYASRLAGLSYVRKALLPVQRKCREDNPQGLIAEGRDCGTVVFPEAPLKIYLSAQESIRARRRASQRGIHDVNKTEELQKKRDEQDRHRVDSPLRRPSGALTMDAGSLSLEDMVKKVYQNACQMF